MTRLVQNSFTKGQLDYGLMGRQDFDGYRKGASKLVNFNLDKLGGINKRQGTDAVLNLTALLEDAGLTGADTKPESVRLIPFAYRKNQGFVLVFTAKRKYVLQTGVSNGQGALDVIRIYDLHIDDSYYKTDKEIRELDYQQCGDVMFIAHSKYPPAKITHSVSGTEDVFTFEECEFNFQQAGIPSISGATIKRTAVTLDVDVNKRPGLKTEEYKVSAMYNGQETYPCNAFRQEVYDNDQKPMDGGTRYYLPWTDSQTITLDINVPSRTSRNGSIEFPDKILVYRKAFNYFGLVGTVRPSKTTAQVAFRDGNTWGALSSITYNEQSYTMSDYGVASNAENSIATTGTSSAVVIASGIKSGTVHMVLGQVKLYRGVLDDGEIVYTEIASLNNISDVNVDDEDIVAVKVKILGNACDTIALNFRDTANQAFSKKTYYSNIEKFDDSETVYAREEEETIESLKTRVEGEISNMTFKTANCAFSLEQQADSISFQSQYGTLRICRVAVIKSEIDTDTIQFVDKYYTPDASITPLEADVDMGLSDGGNYPSVVCMHQQRLVWASSDANPARIWMSQAGDFYSYSQHEIITDDDAIDFVIPITKFAKINHAIEMRKLILFNSACEWIVDSASSTSGVTYKTIQATPQSYSGSADNLKPLVCNNVLIFASRSCQEVRRYAWDLSNDGFAGRDISVLSASIFKENSIRDWTYQQFPNSTIWMALSDGTMASLTYMEEQEIIAWGTHKHGCPEAKVIALSTSSAMSPAIDQLKAVGSRANNADYENATHDEVFVAVKYGNAVWIERMRVSSKREDTVYHQLCMDSVRVLSAANQRKAREDNKLRYVRQKSTDGAAKTLQEAKAAGWLDSQGGVNTEEGTPLEDGEEVYEGFPIEATFVSTYPITSNSAVGAGQFDVKNITNVGFRLAKSSGGEVAAFQEGGIMSDDWEPIRYCDNRDVRPVFDGTGNAKFFDFDASNVKPIGINSRDGRVIVKQESPWPFGILMYEVDIVTENERYERQ